MNYIDTLNSKLIASIDDINKKGLSTGKMGLCIYFYYLSLWERKEEYKQIAEKLLNEVVNNLSNRMELSMESGLAGIAFGIRHLVKEKFIDGDINELFEEVDSRIFKFLVFSKNDDYILPKQDLIHFLYYLYIRYTDQISFDNKYIYQELLIKTIEMFKHELPTSFFNENLSFSAQNYKTPFFLYMVRNLHILNIYNIRLNRISEEYMDQILSIFPTLHANRLYLLCGLLNIRSLFPKYQTRIDINISLLKEKIYIEHIINIELKNQDIYINNGVSLIYLLLLFIQKNFPEHAIDYNPQLFFNRIMNSEAWLVLLNRPYYYTNHSGLFDGFPGANLVLLHIKNNLNEI